MFKMVNRISFLYSNNNIEKYKRDIVKEQKQRKWSNNSDIYQ